tara:strand:+ start:96 stop:350 length:255 start_codon:yes stop_codon:yes gene_type:complete
MSTNKQQADKLFKEQWDQMTFAEKRALAQKHQTLQLELSKTLEHEQARQQTRDAADAARKWKEDAPMREGFKEYMAAKRRLMRG